MLWSRGGVRRKRGTDPLLGLPLLPLSRGEGGMSALDPYYVAKDDVQKNTRSLQQLHEEWKKLLNSENTAKSRRFQDVHSEISGELRQLEYDLQDINATIDMVEENRGRFQFDDSEIQSRKNFVKESRAALKEIQDSITSRQAMGKMESDKRQVLTTQANAAKSDHSERIARDNDRFIENERQEQMQIRAQQDEQLDAIASSAQRLNYTAQVISTELQDQQRMLAELDEDIDKETEKLNFVMKRVGRLLKTSDSKQLCVIIALFLLFVVLLFLVIEG
eukprot:gnl/TRDRNA2_/TRDRNA2_192274_c0_seq1.p1 gnl/TRDRNA2_/TRDRNA2_192274_c0~~gnl/TRDRNA2_/TRDRNA2_192274_c0_seq1.p1  ORF type:complete len:277 (+),score=74.48 gnl/TRDRNA2_/TRDRNA2_192274_c0_seq1:7-837(+)